MLWMWIKKHKTQKCNKKNNIFVINNEKKMKEEDMGEIMREYGEVKNLKLRFYLNNTRNEAMIFIIFLDYTRLKSVWKKLSKIFKRHVSVIL